ncbi:MAG: hypothetical protein M1833_002244 [Piccolia ochrophora]|nr:MAG: hypothetical protein M1833_002244 [Piccolia ochrophora]
MESTQSDRPKPQGQYHSAFGRLPGEIIEHILYRVDPSTFASLVVLNRRWRRVTQSVHLYAHHLSRCPSYSASNNTRSDLFKDGDLPFLRRRFESEVKRNLFEAYLQPDQTIINLVSTSTTSSSAFPAGEAFHFSFSPRGLLLLAFSSSRMFVIDIASPIVSVKREFKILRRPAAATILDDGLLLAVLSSDHQLNLYDLMNNKTQHLRSLTLDNAPRRIVLSPRGSVLAAAYEGGIEIYSVASDSTSADRRAVKCDPVDHLSFSADGTRLLGTTLQSPHPSTFILSAPYYNDGGCDVPASELLSQMWRTQILFPNSSRDCSHTTLLPQSTQDGTNWTFTYDRVFETFRAVRVDDLRNGTTYFTGPTASGQEGPLLPSTVPAASQNGELVAAAFRGKELWVYGVPEDLESVLDPVQASGADGISGSTPREVGSQNVAHATTNERYPQSPEVQTESRVPQWQILCDKSRNVFTHGRHIANVNGITDLRWVFQDEDDVKGRSGSERLVAVAPGGVDIEHDDVEHGTIPVDGGRVIVLDFSHGARRAERRSHTIEVGEQVPESLEEESRDMDMEVALARRRTVAQHHNDMSLRRQSVSRTVSSEATQPPIPSLLPPIPQEASHLLGSASSEAARRFQATVSNPEEGVSLEEVQAALDDPYSHTQPRSQTTLHRAATAAAVNLRHNPRSTATSPVAHRRAGGRSEIPDESDADNWVPPPPPYTADADVPLPAHLRWTLLQSNTEPVSNARDPPERPARASTVPEEGTPIPLTESAKTLCLGGQVHEGAATDLRRMSKSAYSAHQSSLDICLQPRGHRRQ